MHVRISPPGGSPGGCRVGENSEAWTQYPGEPRGAPLGDHRKTAAGPPEESKLLRFTSCPRGEKSGKKSPQGKIPQGLMESFDATGGDAAYRSDRHGVRIYESRKLSRLRDAGLPTSSRRAHPRRGSSSRLDPPPQGCHTDRTRPQGKHSPRDRHSRRKPQRRR